MAKILTNKKTDKTYYFSDKFEYQMLELKDHNMHNEVRFYIANKLGLRNYADNFAKFVNLQFMTMGQMNERYELTQKFLREVTSSFGVETMRYVTQFL